MRIGQSHSVFPVPLYVTLCVCLIALAKPEPVRGIQRRLHGLCSTTLRWFLAQDLQAVSDEEHLSTVDLERSGRAAAQSSVTDLFDRLESVSESTFPASGLRDRAEYLPRNDGAMLETDELVGVVARVLDRRGDGGPLSELILDRRFADLSGAESWVTSGDVLLGFLQASPVPERDAAGLRDPLAGHARVRLLHHSGGGEEPRRLPCETFVAGRSLRFLIEPARPDAAFPLRCALWSDPYLAASRAGLLGAEVFSSDSTIDASGAVPEGLRIGHVRVYGYQQDAGVVPVDYFVEPERPGHEVVFVTLWQRPGGSRMPGADRFEFLRGISQLPAALLRFRTPTAGGQRFLLSASGSTIVPVGGAVTDGLRYLGRIETSGSGFGVMAAFGEPGDRAAFVILPKLRSRAIMEFEAEVVRREDDRVLLRLAPDLQAPPGELFVGGSGPDCPPGLWIGPLIGSRPGWIEVRHRALDSFPRDVQLLKRRGSR